MLLKNKIVNEQKQILSSNYFNNYDRLSWFCYSLFLFQIKILN